VVAVREAVPTPDAIDGFEAQVQAVAAAHGGEYDGWGSAIVP
jgi:regulator of RNase E activity RraB